MAQYDSDRKADAERRHIADDATPKCHIFNPLLSDASESEELANCENWKRELSRERLLARRDPEAMDNGRDAVKQRATVVCQRGTKILLVSRDGVRWSLPGGKCKCDEDIQNSALRELMEETGLHAVSVRRLFEFSGMRTHHTVFAAQIPDGQHPVPSSEIRNCRWVKVTDVGNLTVSVCTKGIVDILAMKTNRPSQPLGRVKRARAFVLNLRATHHESLYCE